MNSGKQQKRIAAEKAAFFYAAGLLFCIFIWFVYCKRGITVLLYTVVFYAQA